MIHGIEKKLAEQEESGGYMDFNFKWMVKI